MAFDKEELKQLGGLFDKQHQLIIDEVKDLLEDQRSMISLDMRTELQPIREELDYIKERIDQLFRAESDDVGAAYEDIESLKRKLIKRL